MTRALTAIFIYASCTIAVAASKPRVAILPWVNDSDSPNLDYLSDSIADAVRSELTKRFVFIDMPSEKVTKILGKNEMQKEDWATSTVAFQLGTWEAQSVVISGRFRAKRRPNGKEGIEITANIFSIYKKVKVSQFKTEAEVSANMFDALAKIGGNIAELAKDILPNPEQHRIAEAIELKKVTNIALFRARLAFAHFPTASADLNATSQVTTADFSLVPGISLEYRRYAIFRPEIGVFAQVDADYRKQDLTGRGTTIPSTLFVFTGMVGPTYHYAIADSFYLSPTLGLGYSYVSIDMKGIDSSIYVQTLKLGTLTGEFRANVGYRIFGHFVVELAPFARAFFYSGKIITDVGVGVSAGYKF